MDPNRIRQILEALSDHQLDVETALAQLKDLPYVDLGFARLDLHRALRKGSGEVVFCEYKTTEQVVAIFERLQQVHDKVLGTRASPEVAQAVISRLPGTRYEPLSRLLIHRKEASPAMTESQPLVAVITAGTADLPVAEEAAQTLEFFDDRLERVFDVGVAGLHRLLDQRETLARADVVISVAGMEGALTSVVAGLVACPVIGVPTSVGYGANFGGLSALLSMLNTCAPGVAVVNIDNGFGAAQMAHAILERIRKAREQGA